MSTVFADYPTNKVAQHPRNVRRTAIADDELVASVTASGILEPVVLGPETADGVRYLIAGNRRFDAATKAGLDTIPAVLRDDLASEADQVAAMLQENLHRADLTAIEEAQAYEQLQLFGADAAEISRTTGVSKATVKGRLRLVALPDDAKETIHTGGASLVEAMMLLDLHEDDQLEVLPFLGTGDFAWKARQAADRRKRAEESAARIAEWTAAGIPEGEGAEIRNMWPDGLRATDAHDGCLAWQDTGYSGGLLVCTDADSHRTPASQEDREERAARTAERQAEAEQREKEHAEKAAARAVRIDALRRTIGDSIPVKGRGKQTLEGIVRAILPALLLDDNLHGILSADSLDTAFDTEGLGWQESREKLRDLGTATVDASWPDVVATLARILAALVEDSLTPSPHTSRDFTAAATTAWDWLAGTGYLLSTADEQARDTATGKAE